MARLTSDNCRVDPHSGAVIFNRPQEAVTLKQLSRKIDKLQDTLDKVLSLLQEEHDG